MAEEHAQHAGGGQMDHQMKMGWGMFAAMIATSAFIMFFLMYQLIYSLDHFFFSTNRMVAALIMGATMTVVMLGYMWSMYRGTGVKIAVLIGAVVIGLAFLAINRSQALIGDVRFMKAMIPPATTRNCTGAEKAGRLLPKIAVKSAAGKKAMGK